MPGNIYVRGCMSVPGAYTSEDGCNVEYQKYISLCSMERRAFVLNVIYIYVYHISHMSFISYIYTSYMLIIIISYICKIISDT